jgi:hypothetical protein
METRPQDLITLWRVGRLEPEDFDNFALSGRFWLSGLE